MEIIEKLIEDAAKGRITVKSSHATLMNYSDFLKSAANGATMKATALVLPGNQNRHLMLDQNKKFIDRGGKIDRIFYVPKTKPEAEQWQKYINEQRKLNVTARFIFLNEVPLGYRQDFLVLSQPRNAHTRSRTFANQRLLRERRVLTDGPEVHALEVVWNEVAQLAHLCNTDTSVVDAI